MRWSNSDHHISIGTPRALRSVGYDAHVANELLADVGQLMRHKTKRRSAMLTREDVARFMESNARCGTEEVFAADR